FSASATAPEAFLATKAGTVLVSVVSIAASLVTCFIFGRSALSAKAASSRGAAPGVACGKLRTCHWNSQSLGTMLPAVPPLMVPTLIVEEGGSKGGALSFLATAAPLMW